MKNLFIIYSIFLLGCSTDRVKDANQLFRNLFNDSIIEEFYGAHGSFRGGSYHIFLDSLYIKYSNDKIKESSRNLTPTEILKVKKIGELLKKNDISSFRGEIKNDKKILEIKKGEIVLIKESNDGQYNWLVNKKILCTRLNGEWFYYKTKAVDNS